MTYEEIAAALDAAHDERCQLIAQKAGKYGRVEQSINARIAAINVKIKRLNVLEAEGREIRRLYQAMREVLDADTYRKVLDHMHSQRLEAA